MKSELNWGQTAIFASFSELKSLPFPAGQVNRPDCTASVFLQNTVVDSSPKRLCIPPPPPPLGCGQESRNVFLFLYSRNLPKVARKYISYQNWKNIAERKKTKCKEWHKTNVPFHFIFQPTFSMARQHNVITERPTFGIKTKEEFVTLLLSSEGFWRQKRREFILVPHVAILPTRSRTFSYVFRSRIYEKPIRCICTQCRHDIKQHRYYPVSVNFVVFSAKFICTFRSRRSLVTN